MFINKVEAMDNEKKKSEYWACMRTEPFNTDNLTARNELKEATLEKLTANKNELELQKKCPSVYHDIQENVYMLESIIDGTQKISNSAELEDIINLGWSYEKGSSENNYIGSEGEFCYWVNRKLGSTGRRLAKVVAKTEHLKDKKRALRPGEFGNILTYYGIAGFNLGKTFVGGIALYSAYQLYNKQSSFFSRYMCPLTLGSIGLYCIYRGIKKTYKLWNYDAIFSRKTDLLDKIGGYLEQKRIWLECVKEQKEILEKALENDPYLSHKIDPNLQIKVI